MSPRSKAAYLWEAADACAAVQEFISGRTLEDYRGNRMLRSAVERELLVVGEALGQGILHFPELDQVIEASRQVVGLRNRLAHEYARIDSSIIWAIAQEHVPKLLERVQVLLAAEDAQQG
jgi:uncharacterized protein with HEPN domain